MARSRTESDEKSGILSRLFGGGKPKRSKSDSKGSQTTKSKQDGKGAVSASERKSSPVEMGDPKWALKDNSGTVSEIKTSEFKPSLGKTDGLPHVSPADMVDQGLRVIVPVDIQALVVEKSSIIEEVDSDKGAKKFSQNGDWTKPGTNGSPLPKGIHLHWAMPDALMVGEEVDDSITPVSSTAGLEEMQTFPPLPNRWVVVRQWPDRSSPQDDELESESRMYWKSKAWIINANDKTATELSQWNSPGPEESLMTAIDDGDPATVDDAVTWTAVYEESKGRFTFHDIPESDVDGPLNYMVAGWYSKATQDPLYCTNTLTRGEWKDILEGLGWSVIEQEILDQIS